MKSNFVFILICALFSTFVAFSQTNVPGGDVYGNWQLEGSPYLISGDITIPNDSTLTIDPGVYVEFQGHFALYVQGRLLAQGTESDTIVFTVNDTTGFHIQDTTLGGWYGIKIADTPEQNDTTKITYCKLQYGKAVASVWWLNAGGAICIVNFDKVIITNCLITRNHSGGPENEAPAGGGIHLAWSDVIISNNTFSYNNARIGGAIQIHESEPTFSNNIFLFNSAFEGGAISTGGIDNITFNGDSFINNSAESHGGGIMCGDITNWTFNNVTFSGNEAVWGAGLGVINSSLSINNCLFDSNISSGIGGGIAADFCEISIINTTFSNDSSSNISGALHGWHCDYYIDSCSFSNNRANQGGAIFTDFSSLAINNSSFTGNSANDGAAIRNWSCDLNIDSTLFQDNYAYSQGGAIDIIVDTGGLQNMYEIKFQNTQFFDNEAEYRCGAISFEQINSETSLVDLIIDNCEFSENHAERIGAIRIIGNIEDIDISRSKFDNNSSDLWTGCMTISNGSKGTVSNSLFTYNSAGSGSSGAVGGSNGSNVNYINCTFGANSAITGGGLALRKESTANLINCIFWGNQPNQLSMNAITDSTPCQLYINYCDIQNGQDSVLVSDSVSNLWWGMGNINCQPLFEDILNNNFQLSYLSPCIGTGTDSIQIDENWYYSPLLDINGNPRPNPFGTPPDMGAYESPFPITTGIDEGIQNPGNPIALRIIPNPVKDYATYSFYLSQAEKVTIKIIDSYGKETGALLKYHLPAGKHTIKMNTDNFISGMYFVLFKAGKHSETKKIIIMK